MTGGQGQRQPTAAEEARLKRARLVLIGKALQFGSTVVGSLLVFLGGGIWLDRRLGTAPLLLLIGLVLSFIAIGYNLYDLGKVSTPKGDSRPAAKPLSTGNAASRSPQATETKGWDDWDDDDEERDEDLTAKGRSDQ